MSDLGGSFGGLLLEGGVWSGSGGGGREMEGFGGDGGEGFRFLFYLYFLLKIIILGGGEVVGVCQYVEARGLETGFVIFLELLHIQRLKKYIRQKTTAGVS